MLPESKNEFPKCLYLDQNKWIDLARAHYGRPDGKEFEAALRAVRTAVASEKLVVPFSVINAIETMAPRDVSRRERLAKFIVDLSSIITILPEYAVLPSEITNLLRRHFSHKRELLIRSGILARGLFNAFGVRVGIKGSSDEKCAAALEMAISPDTTIELLLSAANDRAAIDACRAEDLARVGLFERARKHGANLNLSPEQRLAVEVCSLFNVPDSPVQKLSEHAKEMGIHPKEFFGAFLGSRSAFIEFVHCLPTFDIMGTMTLARNQDQVRSIDANDLRDLIYLSVAIPYANIVVMENYWGHQVRATKLDEKYDTVVISDARQLPEVLQALGCFN